MPQLLFLLLPVAAFSGWYIGQRVQFKKDAKARASLPSKYFSGMNYLLNEQTDKAVDVFMQMIDIDDELIETHLLVGSIYRRRGEVDRAIRIHQSLMMRPNISADNRAVAQLELAKDFIHAGVLNRAEELLQNLIELGEQLEPALGKLLGIYQQGKDWQRAAEVALRLQQISDDSYAKEISHFYCELAQEAWLNGSLKDAEAWIRKALQANKRSVRASILQGNMYASTGKNKEAIKAYQRVNDQDPEFLSEVIDPMGKCYAALNNPEGMFNYLKKNLPERPAIKIVLSFSDWLLENQGSHAALKFITEHLRKFPSIRGLARVIQLNISCSSGKLREDLQNLQYLIERLVARKPAYRCENCGLAGRMFQWLCPSCHHWESTRPILGLDSE